MLFSLAQCHFPAAVTPYPYTPPHQPLTNTAVATLQWVPPEYVDWYVNVEPIEPELTQLIYVWTNKLE